MNTKFKLDPTYRIPFVLAGLQMKYEMKEVRGADFTLVLKYYYLIKYFVLCLSDLIK